MENEKLNWIDALKGIGIILIVLGHTHVLFRTYIYSFHIPLFFSISGFLFQEEKCKFSQFVIKKVKTLLFPYVFFSLLSILIYFVVSNKEISIIESGKQLLLSTRNNITINPTLWFFTCLFAVETIYFLLCIIFKNRYVRTLIIIAISILGFYTIESPILPFSFDSAAYFMLFYAIGNLMREFRQPENHKIFKYITTVCLLVALFFVALPSIFSIVNNAVPNWYITKYAYSVCIAVIGIFASVRLSFLLQKSEALIFFGKNSIVIFTLHIFILDGIYYLLTALGLTVNQSYNIYGVFVTVVCLALMKPIAQFINNNLPRLLGKGW